MYKAQIDAYFDKHQDEIVENIKRMVRIPSVARPDLGVEGAPFGPQCRKVLNEAMDLGRELGFRVNDDDGYVLEFNMNDKPAELAILAHLDVVPEGDGWDTPPYDPQIRGEYMYGRGVDDDKGPAIVSLYAMKAAMEINPNMSKGCRALLGSAEEIGSPDLRHYEKSHTYPKKAFSPDASYPVINIEKGSYAPTFGAKWAKEQGARLVYLHAGTVANVVPKQTDAKLAEVKLADVQAACQAVCDKVGTTFTARQEGDLVAVTMRGMDAHASTPQKGNNALTAMLQALNNMPLAPNKSRDAVAALVKLFPHGDWSGEAIGVKMEDEKSGALTLNFSICDFSEEGFSAKFDSRVPICGNKENMKDVVDKALAENGIPLLEEKAMRAPHHTPEEYPFVQTLLRAYEAFSGEKGYCKAIGGGTYAHGIEGAVAFGCSFPGDPPANIHSANEQVSIKRLMQSAKIFTQIILDECR